MKAKDIRKGTVVLFKDAPHTVLEFQHRTPGNLRAFVQAKLINVLTGIVSETRFISTEDLQVADVFQYPANYLYKDNTGYHFMNNETYEEILLTAEILGDLSLYLQDGMTVQVSYYDEMPIGVVIPKNVTLTVVDTQPELKGATASNSPKPATLDTGLVVNVPAFIKIGEKIIVDTEEGKYISRA